ncbi:hypothetical protein JQX13_07455 [Archangium violaceum]|uniref:hypothetical protein n=1 Tax=Archangium violaceum TaxID=83451 RepID=UPI00193B937A|nr:hypothetical protein [Archangium violaceum]QRK09930.1 hypothetical protein JQX13_07455 [Archangium violaceum]
MSSLSRLFAALVTISLIGAACATKEGATTAGGSSTVEEVPNETTTTDEAMPQVQLQQLSAPEGFTVMFPGNPQPQRGKVAIPGGEVQTAAWTISDPNGVLYSISTADYPEKVVAANPASAFLNEGKTGLVNQLKGTIKAEEDITLQGYPGKSFTVSSDSGEVRARNFLVGPRLYTLLVLYNPSIGAPQADQFLSSLELVNPPPAITPASAASDGGTPAGDAGTPAGDAGTATDAGTPAGDAGTATDAGTPAKPRR